MSSIDRRGRAARKVRASKSKITHTPGCRFVMQIGANMLAPAWREGDFVEFETVDPHGPLIAGEDYYVRFGADAVFKRLALAGDDALTFTSIDGDCLRVVPRKEIRLAAVALFRFGRRDSSGNEVSISYAEMATQRKIISCVSPTRYQNRT